MTRRLLFLLVALSVTACGDPRSDQPEPSPAHQALRDIDQAYGKALQAGDPAAIVALHADDAIVLPHNGPVLRGTAAIQTEFTKRYADPTPITLHTDDVVVASSGDLAYLIGRSSDPTGVGKYLSVYRKSRGTWKIAGDIWNMDQPAQTTAEANREIVETAYADFARGDIPAVLATLHPKIVWTDAEGYPYAGTYTGPETVSEKIFSRIGAEWDAYEAAPSAFIAENDHVIVLGTYRGTYKATGRSVISPFAHVWQLRDGKAVRFRQFTDGPPFQRAVAP